MKTIKLNNGDQVIIDDEWYPILSKWKWKCHIARNGKKYAIRNAAGGRGILMHRYIMMATGNSEIDHKDGDGLNNREENLRFVTHLINCINRGPQTNNTSGYKGVCFDKNRRKYMASISANRKQKNIGRFDTAEEAARAYNKAAHIMHGEMAWLNDV